MTQPLDAATSKTVPALRLLGGLGAFTLVLTLALAYFVPHVGAVGETDDYHWGLCDFRDAVYFPSRAVLEGVNPYDPDAYRAHFEGQVRGTFKLYSPLTFVLFLPLGFLPFHTAGYLFTAINLGLLLVAAALSLRWCGWQMTVAATFGLGALILASQPGQTNLNFGQVTWPLVLGSYLGLALARERPGWSGLALALASFKPHYAVLVGVLMLCRGDFRAVAYGVAYSILGAVAGFVIMAACGVNVADTLSALSSNQREFYADSAVDPVVTRVRIDLPVLLVKALGAPSESWNLWLPAVVVMLATAGVVWRETRQPENRAPDSFATFVLCLGTLVGVYHLVYDELLLTLPIVAMFISRHSSWRRLPTWGLISLRGLAVLLTLNFLWTGPGVRLGNLLRERLPELILPSDGAVWQFVTLLNPLLLALMWVLAVGLSLTNGKRPMVASQI